MKSALITISAAAVLGMLGWVLCTRQRSMVSEAPVVAEAIGPASKAVAQHPATAIATLKTPGRPAELATQATNSLALIVKGELLELTLAQVESYLQANHRNAESLLTAYQATHQRELLAEAMTKYPNDPRVAYTAWFRAEPSDDDTNGLKAKRQALDTFKHADPDNALANYLSAANYFKTGQPDLAVQEMQAGASKPRLDDYVQNAIQDMQEAYQAAGYSEVEAKLAATTGALLPHLAELKGAGMSLLDLANSYQQAGDAASSQEAFQMCLDLGQRLDASDSTTLLQILVGIAIEQKAYAGMGAAASDPSAAREIQAGIDALKQRREDIKEMVSSLNMESWFETAPAEDVNSYLDRQRLFGEQRAMQWLANRQKQ